MMSETQKNILQRINNVRKKVNYVQKDKIVQNQYKAVTHDAVTGMVRGALIDEGVVIIPSLVESEVISDTGQSTKTGTPIIRYEASFQVVFLNIDDKNDCISMNLESHAMDTGDKAPGKALSYAVKYAILKIFNIETGEDEESRYETAELITADQAADIKALIEEVGADEKKFLQYVGVSLVSYIRAKDLPKAIAALEAKRVSNDNS